MTLIGTQTSCSDSYIVDEVFAKLPKGSPADAAKLSQEELLIYADYILERKALVIDVKVGEHSNFNSNLLHQFLFRFMVYF